MVLCRGLELELFVRKDLGLMPPKRAEDIPGRGFRQGWNEVWEQYVGKRVPTRYHKKGAANPVRYYDKGS